MIRLAPTTQALLGRDGRVDAHWERWFGDLARAVNSSDSQPAPAPETPPASLVQGYGIAVTGAGSPDSPWVLRLREIADSGSGTLQAITRDSYGRITGTSDATITGTAGQIEVANGDAAAGVPTLSLAEVADAGGGTLLKIVRDAWGRITGTSTPTTTDLAEGGNLYYTDTRADARVAIHADRTDNPHGVTAAQVGADPAGTAASAVSAHEGASNPHPQYLQSGDEAVQSVNGKTGAVSLDATDVGAATSAQGALADSAVQPGDLAVVATSGDYGDLSSLPTLGTAAAADADDFDPSGSAAAAQAYAVQRANHTGTQVASTISDFAATVRSTVLTGLSTATNAAIAATDTVLQALGKLQAQVSDKASLTTNNTYAGRQTFNDIVKFVQQTPELVTTGVAYGFAAKNYGNGTGTGPQWVSSSSDGTEASPTNTKLNDTLGSFSFRGYDGSAFTGSKGFFTFQAAADWDASSNPTKMAISLTPPGSTTLTTRLAITESGSILPGADNVQNLGSGSARLKEIFCGNGTINTSDAREKTTPRHLTPDELAAALDIARLPCVFQWLHAIEAKGEGARLHASPTVQDVIAAMEAHGLDPMRYGFICYDEWDEQPEVTETEPAEYDDEGNLVREEQTVVVQEHRPAGNRYSLRPSELAHFIQAAVVQRQDAIEARLAALEG